MADSIGIWGGTFDPVHAGHLQMAQRSCEQLQLDRMVMLPAGVPPHRTGTASGLHRLAMLEAAVVDYPLLEVDAREIHRAEPSWSVLTCREFRTQYPAAKLVWCMGSDAFALFHTWHAWQEILALVNIAVIDRPDAPLAATSEVWQHVGLARLQTELSAPAGSVVCLRLHKVPVSSSSLRSQLRAGLRPEFGLPDAVWHYIINHKLYSQ